MLNPCVNPSICGSRYHKDLNNCKAQNYPNGAGVAVREERVLEQSIPDHMQYDRSLNFKTLSWMDARRRLHRIHEPAVQVFNRRGVLIREEWYVHGAATTPGVHTIEYTPNGLRSREEWRLHDRVHRKDGPAILEWNARGWYRESWYQHGQLHRDLEYPAILIRDSLGQIRDREWYWLGRRGVEQSPSTALLSA